VCLSFIVCHFEITLNQLTDLPSPLTRHERAESLSCEILSSIVVLGWYNPWQPVIQIGNINVPNVVGIIRMPVIYGAMKQHVRIQDLTFVGRDFEELTRPH
jgi:hypothetical protein